MTLQAVLDDIRKRPGSGDVIRVIDPTTEEPITEFTDCGPEAVDEAAARAKASFEAGVWSQLPGRERAKIIWRIADLIDANAEEFAQLDSLNTGMPLMQATLQMSTVSEFFRYYAGWCSKINGVAYDVKTDGIATDSFVDMHAYTLKEPYGVVGLIFPWNGPIFNASAKLAPALAAGCSMLVKPAEETPLSALLLDRLIHEAGVPEGVVNLLTGYGHTAGAAITAHPDVQKVAFTGSTEVGKEIVRASADNLKKVTLELGGKSPVLIFDDADMDKAILMASLGIFVHSGQGCVCGSRIFAQRGVYDQVVEGISMMANTFKLGAPSEEGCVSGPLISQKQLTRVMGFIDEGKQRRRRGRHRRLPAGSQGLLRAPDRADQRRHEHAALPAGDLRTRCHHPAVRRRGRGGGLGQRHHLRPGRHGLDAECRPGPPDAQATASGQRSGQLPVGL